MRAAAGKQPRRRRLQAREINPGSYVSGSELADAVWILGDDGQVQTLERKSTSLSTYAPRHRSTTLDDRLPKLWGRAAPSLLLPPAPPIAVGALVVARSVPDDYLARLDDITAQTNTYIQQRQANARL